MDDRMTIANMAIEAGGKNAIFEYDAAPPNMWRPATRRNGTKTAYEPVKPDKDQKFVYELVVDLEAGADGGLPSRSRPAEKAKDMGDLKLDRAYVGSCTGGKTSDFVEFARVLRGRQVVIDTFGVPATPEIVHELQTTRWEAADHLADPRGGRGANDGERRLRRVPGRSGGHLRAHQPVGIKCISATNRNFPGRMGDKESQVFLASPATVAASALTGQGH